MQGPGRDDHHPTPWQPQRLPAEAAQMRVSDSERHAVAEVLREAAGDGRLELSELEERLEAAFAAKTYGDLVPLTADLPVQGASLPRPTPHPMAPSPGFSSGPVLSSSFALMSETKRSGLWRPGPEHNAVAVMGSVVLDLRQATFEVHETEISATAVMGSVQILVNPGTLAVVSGVGIMGSFAEARPKVPLEPREGAPVVRVSGVAFWGSVEVKRVR